jgi:hypothetical protein
MAITFWRNVQRKITTQEMDASFDTLVNDIANAGLSAEMPEGQIYIGDNTNNASLETLDTSIVPETTDKRYQSDLQDTYNDATSSIQVRVKVVLVLILWVTLFGKMMEVLLINLNYNLTRQVQ